MKRLWATILLCGWAGLVLTTAASAQTDTIKFHDHAKKKDDTVRGAIQSENAGGITVKAGASTRDIAANDIVDIDYGVRPALLQAYRKATNRDDDHAKFAPGAEGRKKAFATAEAAFKEAVVELKDAPASVQRHLQFRMARLLARQAEDDAEQVEPAISALSQFLKENPDSWQLSQAAQLLSQLQQAKGDTAAAQKTFEDMAARGDLPKQVRADFEFLAVQGLIRANKHAQAQTKLEKMAREILPTDPQAVRVQVYLAQCQAVAKNFGPAEAKLKELVGANIDSGVKGLVFNTLGDICQDTKRPDDAFWNYLWVDVVYNQDKHEQAKALYNLSKLFSEVRNDPARAQQCRERLLHDKDFQGLDYQKLAAKERKD